MRDAIVIKARAVLEREMELVGAVHRRHVRGRINRAEHRARLVAQIHQADDLLSDVRNPV